MKKILLFIFAVCFLAIGASAQRLPEIAVPHHYILTLAPDLKTETFTGDEVIHGDTLKPTNKIVLNALEIEFQDSTIQALPATKDGKPGEVQKVSVGLDPQNEMATLQFPHEIQAGPFEFAPRRTRCSTPKWRSAMPKTSCISTTSITASSIRSRSSTSSPSPIFPPEPWRTRPLSPTARPYCWSTRRTSPTNCARMLPTCWRTRWHIS